MKCPPDVPPDAAWVDDAWRQGRVTTKPLRGGATREICDGPIRRWRADGSLIEDSVYEQGELVTHRLFHPDGALSFSAAYEGRGMARREHGVRVYQRSVVDATASFPEDQPASVWRVEETYVHGRRTKVRTFTRDELAGAGPAERAALTWNVVDAASFAKALAGLFESAKPGKLPVLGAWTRGRAIPADVQACLDAVARAGFPRLPGWTPGSLANMKKPPRELAGRALVPLGMNGGGCPVVYALDARRGARVFVVDETAAPIAIGVWDFARMSVVRAALDRGALAGTEPAKAMRSLAKKARDPEWSDVKLPALPSAWH